jgi:hypothetical protein
LPFSCFKFPELLTQRALLSDFVNQDARILPNEMEKALTGMAERARSRANWLIEKLPQLNTSGARKPMSRAYSGGAKVQNAAFIWILAGRSNILT